MSTTYAINTETLGLTQFSNLSLVGLVDIDGTTVLLAALDLFEFTGTTDDGVALVGYVTTGALTFGNQSYNIPKYSFAGAGSGDVTVTPYMAQHGGELTGTACSESLAAALDQFEMYPGTRYDARRYKLKIAMDGSGDVLESFEIYINPVRHRRG